MNKTILIGTRSILSNRASFWVLLTIGTAYLIIGGINLFHPGSIFESVGNMVFGVIFCAYAIFTFSTTPLTSRVRIGDSTLEFRKSFFGKTWQLDWSEIMSMEFRSFEIQFNLKDNVKVFSYNSKPETSIDIKKSIREMAEKKDIEVIGG